MARRSTSWGGRATRHTGWGAMLAEGPAFCATPMASAFPGLALRDGTGSQPGRTGFRADASSLSSQKRGRARSELYDSSDSGLGALGRRSPWQS